MPALIEPAPGAPTTQWFGEYPTAGPAYADQEKEAIRRDLIATYGNYQPGGHDGEDKGCGMRTPLRAPSGGTIDFSGFAVNIRGPVARKYGLPDGQGNAATGLVVMGDCGDGYGWLLAHMDQTDVDHLTGGGRILRGQHVGLSGNSGRSGGPHVHFSVVRFSQVNIGPLWGRVNPRPFMINEAAGAGVPASGGELLIPDLPGLGVECSL